MMGDPISRRLWNVREVADVTRLSKDTIYKMDSEKRIPYVKMGRRTMFDSREIDRWIDKHSVKPRREIVE